MRRPIIPSALKRPLLSAALGLDLAVLYWWGNRPPRNSYYWGLQGGVDDTPARRVAYWMCGDSSPHVPSQLLILLWPLDTAIGACLIGAMIGLAALIVRRSVAHSWRALVTAPLRIPTRWRVGTAMAVLAVLGGLVGWEIGERRDWERRRLEGSVVISTVDQEISNLISYERERRQLAQVDRQIKDQVWLTSTAYYNGALMGRREYEELRARHLENMERARVTAATNAELRRKIGRGAGGL